MSTAALLWSAVASSACHAEEAPEETGVTAGNTTVFIVVPSSRAVVWCLFRIRASAQMVCHVRSLHASAW